jgi:hypothetical protein
MPKKALKRGITVSGDPVPHVCSTIPLDACKWNKMGKGEC